MRFSLKVAVRARRGRNARGRDDKGRRFMKREDIVKIALLLLMLLAGVFLFFYFDLYTFFVDREKIEIGRASCRERV